MSKKRPRFTPALWFASETLESRVVLSTSALHQGAADVAAQGVQNTATHTSLAINSGTLGQPTTFTVTVRASSSAGAPTGTVNIVDHGSVIQTLNLSPTPSPNGRFAYSAATYTLTPQPGGPAYFFGRHNVSATYSPTGAFSTSTGHKAFTVSQPAYTTLAGGTKVATITPGAGAQIQSGQTAGVLYTGYLARGGRLFDDSISHGGAPFHFKVGAGQVVPGFDAGVVGMKVGETRIVSIPSAQGYGRTAYGPIPANSNLVFVLTLASIS